MDAAEADEVVPEHAIQSSDAGSNQLSVAPTVLAQMPLNVLLANKHLLNQLLELFLHCYGPLFPCSKESLMSANTPAKFFQFYSALILACRAMPCVELQAKLVDKARSIACMLFDECSVPVIFGFILFAHAMQGRDDKVAAHYACIADSLASLLSDPAMRNSTRMTRALTDSKGLEDFLANPGRSSDLAPEDKAQVQVIRCIANLMCELQKACEHFTTLFFSGELAALVADLPTPLCVSQSFSKIGINMCRRAQENIAVASLARSPLLQNNFSFVICGLRVIITACSAQARETLPQIESALDLLDQSNMLYTHLPIVVPHVAFMGRLCHETGSRHLVARIVAILTRLTPMYKSARTALQGMQRLAPYCMGADDLGRPGLPPPFSVGLPPPPTPTNRTAPSSTLHLSSLLDSRPNQMLGMDGMANPMTGLDMGGASRGSLSMPAWSSNSSLLPSTPGSFSGLGTHRLHPPHPLTHHPACTHLAACRASPNH